MARFGRCSPRWSRRSTPGRGRPRRGRRAGRLVGRSRQRRPGAGRHDRRGPGADRRREGRPVARGARSGRPCRSSPAPAPTTRPTGRAHRPGRAGRRGRRAGRHPVLQPAAPGGHRGPLPGRRRRHRPAGADLRHPGPHRRARSATTCCSAWRATCQHRRPSRMRPVTRPARPADRRRPGGFEVYCGDDAMTLPLLAVGAVGVISVAAHWAGDEMREMSPPSARATWTTPARSTPADPVVRLRDRRPDAQPDPGQGHAARPRPARRAVPPSARARTRRTGSPRARRSGRDCGTMADPSAHLPRRPRRDRPQLRLPRGRRSHPVIDCGLMFPDLEMPGVDLVLPDFTWLRENADRVEACVLTHGHEDHVGGLSFLLRDLTLPDLRLRAHPRPGPQPHRGGRPARPDRAHRRCATASGG